MRGAERVVSRNRPLLRPGRVGPLIVWDGLGQEGRGPCNGVRDRLMFGFPRKICFRLAREDISGDSSDCSSIGESEQKLLLQG